MYRAVMLENVRSAYNVWNVIRTADALRYDVILSWYTPSPTKNSKILKTSLWAEKNVKIHEYRNCKEALEFARRMYKNVYCAEITESAKSVNNFFVDNNISSFCIIFWNEVSWVLWETLELCDDVLYIPMLWKKESLNVWQSTAIFMWEWMKWLI